MRSLSNLSVTRRMALGFSLILLLSMAVIGLSILRLNQLADATQEMVKNPVQTERLVSDWARNLASGITRAAAVARSSDPALADFFAAENKDSSRRSSELQKAVEAAMTTLRADARAVRRTRDRGNSSGRRQGAVDGASKTMRLRVRPHDSPVELALALA